MSQAGLALMRRIEVFAREAMSGLRPDLLARCRKCKRFEAIMFASKEACSVCDWHTALCHDCAKHHSVEKSLMFHMRYYSRPDSVKLYGGAHKKLWAQFKDDESLDYKNVVDLAQYRKSRKKKK